LTEPRSVFVTGALGFIGRAVAARYSELGADVRGVDLRADPALGVVEGDVAEPGPWQEAMAGSDLVVHTAAAVTLRSDPAPIWRANALGTRNVIDAAARAGARRLVHLSSVTVFSFRFPDGVGESYPVRANGVPYVDTKIAAEQAVLHAHGSGEVDCVVLRPGDVYGPGSRPWTVLPVQKIAARQFLVPAMGRGVFSPVYIDNLVDGVVLAGAAPDAGGRVYTLTDGAGVTTREYFGHYARLVGRRLVVAPTPVARAMAAALSAAARGQTEINAASADYLARTGTYSIERARSELGYEPAVGLAEGMRRTEGWLRAEGLV
jgi:nucleoside-diphosphate-sugar epimerase